MVAPRLPERATLWLEAVTEPFLCCKGSAAMHYIGWGPRVAEPSQGYGLVLQMLITLFLMGVRGSGCVRRADDCPHCALSAEVRTLAAGGTQLVFSSDDRARARCRVVPFHVVPVQASHLRCFQRVQQCNARGAWKARHDFVPLHLGMGPRDPPPRTDPLEAGHGAAKSCE